MVPLPPAMCCPLESDYVTILLTRLASVHLQGPQQDACGGQQLLDQPPWLPGMLLLRGLCCSASCSSACMPSKDGVSAMQQGEIPYLVEDIWVRNNDAQVHVDWRHQPALELELPKLDGLHPSSALITKQGTSLCRA